jgi:hypothetical protein
MSAYNVNREIRSSPRVIQVTQRGPNQIRADCVRKLMPIETGDMITTILAVLLDEDWTTPKIEELFITWDCFVLPRPILLGMTINHADSICL